MTLACSDDQFQAHKLVIEKDKWGIARSSFLKKKKMENEVIQEEIVEYKVYKEKPYLNSAREPFGLTLNGRTKEYLKAHEALKGIIKKGKRYSVGKGIMKILDVTNNKAMVNAIIEISDNGVSKGNVELKVHNPSLTKKKGATLELRKMSSFDYENVEIVKTMITTILDGVIAGAEVTEVLKNLSNNVPLKNVAGKVTSKPKLFSCCICSF